MIDNVIIWELIINYPYLVYRNNLNKSLYRFIFNNNEVRYVIFSKLSQPTGIKLKFNESITY